MRVCWSATVREHLRPCLRVMAGVGLLAMLRPCPSVRADPNVGEARSPIRDADRVYTVVAGEGDGTSTVANPANLGFLKAVNGILDVAFTDPRAHRRGSGAGAFVGIPLPFRILALGIGYQYLWPRQDPGGQATILQRADEAYSKITIALAVPLLRWVRGLSAGVSYSRLAGHRNLYADDVNQVDLAIGYRPTRFLALGLVVRGVNTPMMRRAPASTAQTGTTLPMTLDPELAFRPFGVPTLELAFGARIAPFAPADDVRFVTHTVDPRGRLFLDFPGFRVFAEAERYRHLQLEGELDAVRVMAGIQLDFAHAGVAVAGQFGTADMPFTGGAGRLRVSEERYRELATSPRVVTRFGASDYRGEDGMWKLVTLLDRLGERKAVVVLETREMTWGWAQTEEVREAVLRARARGATVVAYLEGASLRSYFLASAADRVVAHPHTSMFVIGMHLQQLYFGKLLERLGARAEFVRIAEYKGRPEVFSQERASEPVARQRALVLTDTWNHVLRLIARDRGQDPRVLSRMIDEAPHAPKQALRLGLVDALAFPDELDRELERWLRRRVRIEKPSERPEHALAYGPGPRIAVLRVEGDLLDGRSFDIPLVARKIAGSDTLTREIERLSEDPGVRAIVVRLDTPGGSVTAADAIARQLDLARKNKPVVISMGNQCASGGYYVATAGQYIFADATTTTGSIGIFFPKVDLTGTLALFGIGVDSYSLGARAGLRSWFKAYTPDERDAIARNIEEAYDIFVDRVAKARAMTPAKVDNVARGRIWSGVRAIDVGLVDAYGGLREAVIRARAMAGLRHDQGEVESFPKQPSLLEQIRSLFGLEIPNPLSPRVAPSRGLDVSPRLPEPLLSVLRELPASLWLLPAPEPLAVNPEPAVVR